MATYILFTMNNLYEQKLLKQHIFIMLNFLIGLYAVYIYTGRHKYFVISWFLTGTSYSSPKVSQVNPDVLGIINDGPILQRAPFTPPIQVYLNFVQHFQLYGMQLVPAECRYTLRWQLVVTVGSPGGQSCAKCTLQQRLGHHFWWSTIFNAAIYSNFTAFSKTLETENMRTLGLMQSPRFRSSYFLFYYKIV